jgi:hypothetical protein
MDAVGVLHLTDRKVLEPLIAVEAAAERNRRTDHRGEAANEERDQSHGSAEHQPEGSGSLERA